MNNGGGGVILVKAWNIAPKEEKIGGWVPEFRDLEGEGTRLLFDERVGWRVKRGRGFGILLVGAGWGGEGYGPAMSFGPIFYLGS